MSFKTKVVLITGAASGIGEAIALHFAKVSAKLSLFDINLDNLNKVSQKCESLSKTRVFQVVVDVTRDADLKEGIDSTIRNYGRIDVLVNCAGISGIAGILNFKTLDVYDKIVNVNLRAIVAITHFAAAALIESRGCIINISSVVGQAVTTNGIAYSISKAAVTHLTKCVALELADKGVRVNSISPGPVKTNIFLQCGIRKEYSDKILDNFADCSPLRRPIKPDEIAELVAFLASDNANSVTGADFVVDLGFALTTSLKPNIIEG